MSRKARVTEEEKSSWNVARYYVFAKGYGPPKPAALIGEKASLAAHKPGDSSGLCVLLFAPEEKDDVDGAVAALARQHPMLPLAPLAAPLLLARDEGDQDGEQDSTFDPPAALIVLDLSAVLSAPGGPDDAPATKQNGGKKPKGNSCPKRKNGDADGASAGGGPATMATIRDGR